MIYFIFDMIYWQIFFMHIHKLDRKTQGKVIAADFMCIIIYLFIYLFGVQKSMITHVCKTNH